MVGGTGEGRRRMTVIATGWIVLDETGKPVQNNRIADNVIQAWGHALRQDNPPTLNIGLKIIAGWRAVRVNLTLADNT
jgi:hypothetical protein